MTHSSKGAFVLGRVAGWTIAPLFGLVSFVRRARTFHPRGITYEAHVEKAAGAPALADRLVGTALVRFSGALWKRSERLPDVLGCALRLHGDAAGAPTAEAKHDQDLLFATIKRPWTMPFAPMTTRVDDYLANDYFAVSPFDVGGDRLVYLRLRPSRPSTARGKRSQRLAHDVVLGRATLRLEVSDGPRGPWTSLATITLDKRAVVDDEALRFRPFHDGLGIAPRGFVHAMRLGVYAVSQRARPAPGAYGAR